MKAVVSLIALAAILYGGWWIYSNSTPTDSPAEGNGTAVAGDKTAVAPGTYAVATDTSTIRWEAQKPLIPGYVHHGTISLSGGTIVVTDTAATGSFTLDMNSIAVTSLGGGKEGKESALEAHLKKSDFFDVETYPSGEFTIESVEPVDAASYRYNVKGTLTLKDTTEPVEFPAMIYEEDGTLRATANLSIDRTKWGISFGSKSVSDKLGDNMIDDTINLELDIVARPQ